MNSLRESVIEIPAPPSRQITITLPEDVPVGSTVRVVVQRPAESGVVPSREELRERMRATGLLDALDWGMSDTPVPTDAEVRVAASRMAALPGPTLSEMIDEDRGPR